MLTKAHVMSSLLNRMFSRVSLPTHEWVWPTADKHPDPAVKLMALLSNKASSRTKELVYKIAYRKPNE